LGDLFYNTDTGKVYRWIKKGSTYSWQELQDSEVVQALALANDALALAQTKRRVFTSTPTTPYEIGDLWVQGASGGIYKCKTTRLTGSYSSSDWEVASKYTDDTALTNFINGAYNTQINDLVNQIDGKIESWFQTSDPSASWTTTAIKAKHVGDMWFNSSTNKLKRYSSSYAWVDITDQTAIDAYNAASQAQDTADGKRRVFVSTPTTPYDVGDLWVNGTDLRRCATAKTSGQFYNINDWVVAVNYDNTKTVIDGGLVTSGTIQIAGSESTILAGMTGQGTAATSIRFWAGASFENRATAPFRVMQDGSVVMTKATVEGIINALTGSIGGFSIAQGRIGVEDDGNGTNDGLSLLTSFIKYSINNTYKSIWSGIGSNVFPATTGMTGLARFQYEDSYSYGNSGIALLTKFRPGYQSYWYTQRAWQNDGNVFSRGGHCFWDDTYIGTAYTNILELYIGVTNQFLFTSIGSSILTVRLPAKSYITAETTVPVSFMLYLTIPTGVSNRIRLTSVTNGQLYNNNGGTQDYIDMASGDTLILRYYNGGWYQVSYRT
jgi:hypothetical protein